MIFSKKIPLHEIVTRFVCPECCPKGIPEGLPRGDPRGATRGTYSSSDIPPILDRMLFSPSEVWMVPPSDGKNILFSYSPTTLLLLSYSIFSKHFPQTSQANH